MYVVTNCPAYVNDDECKENSLIRQRCDNRDCIIKQIINSKNIKLFDVMEVEDD
ncbi:MAG: hypothetical protein IKY45_03790 [Clostridia bacterium]|nr:hypothetical protein [Clostridia bacterium]